MKKTGLWVRPWGITRVQIEAEEDEPEEMAEKHHLERLEKTRRACCDAREGIVKVFYDNYYQNFNDAVPKKRALRVANCVL